MEIGSLPLFKRSYNDPDLLEKYPYWVQFGKQSAVAQALPLVDWYDELVQKTIVAVQQMFQGTKSAQDVGDEIAEFLKGREYNGMAEEVVYDPKTGVKLNGNLIDYKVWTFRDIEATENILVETGMGYGPYGLVGIGEDCATVVPFVIGNAIHNAIGEWVDEHPMTPNKVIKAIQKAKEKGVF